MISTVKTSKGTKAITSDQWHVVHSRFTNRNGKSLFVRIVSSEHDNRDDCVEAARALRSKLAADATDVPAAEQDEVMVRKPNYKSLERSKHRRERPN